MNPVEPARELEASMVRLRLEIGALLYTRKFGFRDPNQPNRPLTQDEVDEILGKARKVAAGGDGLDRGL